MSTTRTETAAKEVKAVMKGAEYAVKAGAATSAILNILGICVTISNPILLGIAGGMAALFCCLGTCLGVKDPAATDNVEHIDIVQGDIEVRVDVSQHRDGQHRRTSVNDKVYSGSSIYTLFPEKPKPLGASHSAPAVMAMESKAAALR